MFQQIVSNYPHLCSSFLEEHNALVHSVEFEVLTSALGTEEGAGKQGTQTEVTQRCYAEVETKMLHRGEM